MLQYAAYFMSEIGFDSELVLQLVINRWDRREISAP